MSLDTQQSIVDCCVPSESERHTSREVERKSKAQRGGFFCRRAAPRQKLPLGGQQAEGAAWGLFLSLDSVSAGVFDDV
ncbi:MAG TPA: hypothetical protein DD803_16965 [Alcaligenes faecalis]|nr:hypothetical protein [Alcaligenes faecalis]